jgi:hypothetical protein
MVVDHNGDYPRRTKLRWYNHNETRLGEKADRDLFFVLYTVKPANDRKNLQLNSDIKGRLLLVTAGATEAMVSHPEEFYLRLKKEVETKCADLVLATEKLHKWMGANVLVTFGLVNFQIEFSDASTSKKVLIQRWLLLDNFMEPL